MAQDITVDLGSFSISGHLDRNFVLILSTSMLLSLPDQYNETLTASELRDQVKAGSLWITRGGSCHFELNIGFGDSLDPGRRLQLQRMIISAFEAFPAWNALGLELRREYNQFNGLQGARSLYPYSVHHDQRNSGLITPDQVPCAYFSALSCNFTFGTGGTHRVTPPRNLMANVPPRRRSKIVTLQVPPSGLRAVLGIPEIYSLPLAAQKIRLEHLTHTALHLMLGSRKRIAGIRILNSGPSPTVLDVAPAVWSSRYFHDVVSRARMAPLISTPLGALISSESSRLRHKIQSLAIDPVEELHRRTVLLILRSARVGRVQYRSQQSSSQSGMIELLDDQVRDFEEPESVAEALEPFQDADGAVVYVDALSLSSIEYDHDNYMSDLGQDDNLPAEDDAFDEESYSEHAMERDPEREVQSDLEHELEYDLVYELDHELEHEMRDSVSDFSECQIDPELLRKSGEFDSDLIRNSDAFENGDLNGMEDDGIVLQQRHDTYFDDMDMHLYEMRDNDGVSHEQLGLYLEDKDGMYYDADSPASSWEESTYRVHGQPDLLRQDELDNDSVPDDEVLHDEHPYGLYDSDGPSHSLSFDDMDGFLQQNDETSSVDKPDEWYREHMERNLHYESDYQVDEEMSDGAHYYMDQNPEGVDEHYQYDQIPDHLYGVSDADSEGDAAELENADNSRYGGTVGYDFESGEVEDETSCANASRGTDGFHGGNGLHSSEVARHYHQSGFGYDTSQHTMNSDLRAWGSASLESEVLQQC